MVLVQAPGVEGERAAERPTPSAPSKTGPTEGKPTPKATQAEQPGTNRPAATQDEPNKTPISDTPREHSDTPDRPPRTFKFREDFDAATDAPDLKASRRPATPAPPRRSPPSPTPAELSNDTGNVEPVPAQSGEVPPSVIRRYQQWLLIGGAAVFGIVLAMIVVGFISSRRSDNKTKSDSIAKSSSDDGQTAAAQDATHDSAAPKVDIGKPAPEDDGKARSKVDRTEPKRNPGAKTTDPSTANGDKVPPAKTPSAPVAGEMAPDGPGTEPAAETVPDVVESGDPEIPGLGKVPTSPEGSGEPPLPAPKNDTEAGTDGLPTHGLSIMSDEAIEAQLSVTVVANDFRADEDVRLADFAEFFLDLTTVPVTLDIDALRAVGVTPEEVIEFSVRGVTRRQLLEAALEPLGVGYSIVPGGIVVAPRDEVRRELTTVTIDVADLAGNTPQVETLAAQIKSLIAVDSWDDVGGAGTLSATEQSLEIHQNRTVHYQITRFLDRLRAARGLLPRSDLPDELLDLPPLFVQAAGDLNMPIAANFAKPTALQHVFDSLQTQTDLRMLVDWQALATIDLPPTRAVSLTSPDQPFYKLLDNWLTPLQLDYRVIDVRTVQISSQTAIDARPDVEIYRISGESDTDQAKLIAEIKTRIGEPFFSADGGTGVLVYDKASHCLLVSLPQPQQRTLAAWLRLNRKTDFGRSDDEN